ncbi:MAG TPA: AMP-binding protein [Candidatus Dormibacteraeota bacterium]|nr:AMP-binding protein [Candidatus Dormibacteraeota bacterium]
MTAAVTESLAELVSSAGRRWPDDIAIALGARKLSYRQLDRAVARVAADLDDRGLQQGDAVAVIAGTGLEFPVLAYGVLRAGGVLLPISPDSPPQEAAALLKAARAELVLSDTERTATATAAAAMYDRGCGVVTLDGTAAGSRGDVQSLTKLVEGKDVPASPDRIPAGSPAVILFTSGSTARPKGVVHSHEGLFKNAQCVAYEMAALTREDVMLGTLPLSHSFGLSAVLNTALLVGARLELLRRFDAQDAWRAVLRKDITVLTGVPTMYRRIAELREASRNSSLRLAIVSGAACPLEVSREVRLRLGIPLIERYGMTEASPLTWRHLEDDTPEADVGWPAWGVRLRATDASGHPVPPGTVGEVEVQSPGMFLRYLSAADNREAFHDGWLRTGDLGRIRPDGGLTLQSRLKEVILRGGYTVSAREVEAVIRQHPAVAEAVVVGLPDEDLGEDIAAMVVLRSGRRTEPAELGRFVGERLATWKRPRRWRIVAELPRTALGKVRRDEIVSSWTEPAS